MQPDHKVAMAKRPQSCWLPCFLKFAEGHLQPFIPRRYNAKMLFVDSELLSINWQLDIRLIEMHASFSARPRPQTAFGVRGKSFFRTARLTGPQASSSPVPISKSAA